MRHLDELLRSRRSTNPPLNDPLIEFEEEEKQPVYVAAGQEGSAQADRITALPGQPAGVDFEQYAGYITVDPKAGRALFYYFVESPTDSSSKPLILWLSGGPGCSSLGYGAMEEIGPFRVNPDERTLSMNKYAWNNVANVLFLESPAGVGFSYSNTTLDYSTRGDKSTADDSFTFLINWLERFPHYKNRDLYIAGENYAGHYAPQLAHTIITRNHSTPRLKINLKGIAIGNAFIDDTTMLKGTYEYYWTHALISDETHADIMEHCDFVTGNFSMICYEYQRQAENEHGHIDMYNIYAPKCYINSPRSSLIHGVYSAYDPCSDYYVDTYLNLPEVQAAFHVIPTSWSFCSDFDWKDSPTTVLPTIKELMASGIAIWIFSGDLDGRVSVRSTRYTLNTLKLPVDMAWRPWYSNYEVGGYVIGYQGLTLVTVRGAGHAVPSYQPERALTMITSFLQGVPPPQ
ncbi:hypothetical protein MLD38_001772 [Melastoma candidum]|uniref:Uncharacterized protein n=1 Tax=Melastoma candidum TaxID=119954 RepID=A0ACB9SMX5_9MYRT|nr:hypothetical protein MLD38_001772 [Melastoma candidum]